MNLRPDIEELLPLSARSVQDYFEVSQRLEATDYLAVLVFPKDRVKDAAAARQFVDTLAQKLEKQPPNLVARVEYRLTDALEFFNRRRAIYLDIADLNRIHGYIEHRIDYEKQLYNPLNIFSGVDLKEPKLDFAGIEKKYTGKVDTYSRLPGGYFATEDLRVYAIMAYLPSGGSKIERSHQLRGIIDEAITPLMTDPAFIGRVDLKYTGGIQDLIEEHHSLLADLEFSLIVVMVLVSIAILLFYRSIRIAWSLMISLIIGTVWSFGISYCAVGYLNANSAFLGAIVIGNGINFGIIFLARYNEEIRAQKGHLRALYRSYESTLLATWVAALAAGLSYGSLAVTSFRGFRQFGIIGLISMVICWVAAYTVLPAILTLLNRLFPVRRWFRPKTGKKALTVSEQEARGSFFGRGIAAIVTRFPVFIVALSVALIVASITFFVTFKGDILETNLANLRDRRSEESGSGFNSRYLNEIFHGYPHATTILAKSTTEAEAVADAFKKRMALGPKESLIASVQSVEDLLPTRQAEKIRILKSIRAILTPRILKELKGDDRKRVDEFLTPEAFSPFGRNELPEFARRRLMEKNGTLGNIVQVEPPGGGVTENANVLMGFVDEVRAAADSVRPGIPVAGQTAITADMIRAIRTDGPKATLLSLIAVVLLVWVLFRRPTAVLPVLLSLFLGVTWLGGYVFYSGLKINFLNFIALPITFGIGVDYSVNIYSRYMLDKDRRMDLAVRNTGGAVTLASVTTIIGWGSLLLAGNRAFVSFGRLAVVGEFTCIFAALFTLPAMILLKQRIWGKKLPTAAELAHLPAH